MAFNFLGVIFVSYFLKTDIIFIRNAQTGCSLNEALISTPICITIDCLNQMTLNATQKIKFLRTLKFSSVNVTLYFIEKQYCSTEEYILSSYINSLPMVEKLP